MKLERRKKSKLERSVAVSPGDEADLQWTHIAKRVAVKAK
jgi:hypothetical protein